MEFTILRENLLGALSKVQGIVEKRNTIPILSNVFIEAKDNVLQITATDLEIGLCLNVQADVKENGKITVSAKKLFEIIKEFPNKPIKFEIEENSWIKISCDSAEFKIVGLPPEEYPFFPEVEEKIFITTKIGTLKSLVQKTAFAMTTDEIKHNLNGIYFDCENDNGGKFVATDSHRLALAESEENFTVHYKLEKGIILPRKGILELIKVIENDEKDIHIFLENNNALFKTEEITFFMRLVDGDFPNFKRVIPEKLENLVIVPKEIIKAALRRISLISNEKSKGVNLQFSNNNLNISSSNPEYGQAQENISIDYNEEEKNIGINSKFILDVISCLDSEEVSLYIKDNMSPVFIKEESKISHMSIIMPMTF